MGHMIELKAADGTTFPTRAAAQAHQDTQERKARVEALLTTKNIPSDGSLAALVAGLGADLIAALTLPSRMGRKPKVAA